VAPHPAEVEAARAVASSIASSPVSSPRLPEPPRAAQPIRIESYALPAADLQAVASAAGLEWVGSDVEKVRAVQAAMAAEPKPVHIPREPKPVAVIDEGPLVLVETRKDLSQMRMPFEQPPQG
jgi:ribonuclease E